MAYYNTTNEFGLLLKEFREIANRQDDKVLFVITKATTKIEVTPSEVHEDYITLSQNNTPLTSIRRSMNTLEKRGLIYKTGRKKIGPYGRPENIYKYTLKYSQGSLF